MNFKLGALPPLYDARDLMFGSYLPEVRKLPPLPPEYNWNDKATKSLAQVYGNHDYGDCVVAGAGHMVGRWTANAGREVVFLDKTITDLYFHLTGGGDDGLYLKVMLNYWRKHGIGQTAPIGAYLSVNPKSKVEMDYATYIFGGVYLAFALPLSAKAQIDKGQSWDVPSGGPVGDGRPYSWGGHCVGSGRYNSGGRVVDTWGMEQVCTDNFVGTYCTEAYVILTLDFFEADHKTPLEFDWATMKKDLSIVTQI